MKSIKPQQLKTLDELTEMKIARAKASGKMKRHGAAQRFGSGLRKKLEGIATSSGPTLQKRQMEGQKQVQLAKKQAEMKAQLIANRRPATAVNTTPANRGVNVSVARPANPAAVVQRQNAIAAKRLALAKQTGAGATYANSTPAKSLNTAPAGRPGISPAATVAQQTNADQMRIEQAKITANPTLSLAQKQAAQKSLSPTPTVNTNVGVAPAPTAAPTSDQSGLINKQSQFQINRIKPAGTM